MSFLEKVRVRASVTPKRIVFPESADERTLGAVSDLARQQVISPILVLDPARPESHARARALERLGVSIVDPATDSRAAWTSAELFAAREHKGMDEREAARLAKQPLFFADALVSRGDADGCVAGAVTTTADVLRAALWLIGPAPGVKTVSSDGTMNTVSSPADRWRFINAI